MRMIFTNAKNWRFGLQFLHGLNSSITNCTACVCSNDEIEILAPFVYIFSRGGLI